MRRNKNDALKEDKDNSVPAYWLQTHKNNTRREHGCEKKVCIIF